MFDVNDVILSDNDDDNKYNNTGQLERADTELHFGGGSFDRDRKRLAANNPYGPAAGTGAKGDGETLGDRYRSRKEELDELVMRKKFEKAEKARHKENQGAFFFLLSLR
jgi:hypothetical protein